MDKNSQIVAGIGLGGIELGRKLAYYSETLEDYQELGLLRFRQTDIYSARYWVVDFPVEIYVDTRIGTIYTDHASKIGLIAQSFRA